MHTLPITTDSSQTSGDRQQKSVLAFRMMHPLFAAIPILFGIDKFFNIITDWPHYVSPFANAILPFTAQQIMWASGPVEILVGILIALKPRIGMRIFAAMLAGIAINVLTIPKELHIAFLDISLAICALASSTLSSKTRTGYR